MLQFIRTICLLVVGLGYLILPAKAGPDASNWCEEAKLWLTTQDGAEVSCEKISKNRCIRMNNYWCQKHDGNDPWKGTPRGDGKDGLQDDEGHAIFESSKWSSRAIARDLRSKYLGGKITAVAIAEAYTPWCDTRGSHAIHLGYGRTCSDRAKPPKDFDGPLCVKPATSTPKKSDCLLGCNCPPEVAQMLVEGLGLGINDDLILFGKDKRPGSNLSVLIRNLARQEQSIFVKSTLIEQGIELLSK